VTGPDPRRIVLSGSGSALTDPVPRHAFRPPGCDIVVGADVTTAAPAGCEVVRAPVTSGRLDLAGALSALRARGVHSIYLEGGSATLSSFLHARCIDLLQVHVAAMVLGSGLPSFTLPPVDHVDHGLRFALDHAMLDGHVLLSCWPAASDGAP
jgi:5-amino-6-(5-phosphoribosylamino)uracil reductase/diaminohydroxyphosphoribosylaminopyrimidine deaminase/5-amino-6-(5-phosphoribosylamino)uracil reductase